MDDFSIQEPLLLDDGKVSPQESGDENEIDTAQIPVVEKKGHASVLGTIYNLINVIVGAGVLGLGYVLSEVGYAVGLGLIIFIGICAMFSGHLLMIALQKANTRSYSELMRFLYGRPAKIFVQILMIAMNFGVLVAYLDIWADIVPNLLGYWFGFGDSGWVRFGVLTAGVVIVFPMAMLKSLNHMRFASIFSLVCVSILMLTLVSDSSVKLAKHGLHNVKPIAPFSMSSFKMVAIVCFSYNGHFSVPILYEELARPKKSKMERVIYVSFAASMMTYIIGGLFAYFLFEDEVEDNVLRNYTPGLYKIMDGVKVIFAVSILFTFPLVHFTCRNSIDLLFFRKRPFSWVRHTVETVLIVGISYTMAIIFHDVSNVFGLTGALTTVSLSYLLPVLCYLKVTHGPWYRPKIVLSIVMFICGFVVMVLASYFAIVDMIKAAKAPK